MKLVKKALRHLFDLPAGSLFLFENTLCLKTEYRTEQGAIEAHIVGSGEMFWGGTSDPKVQSMHLVTELEVDMTPQPELVDGIPYVPFPIAFHTVDVIAINNDRILLGRKPQQEKWQFVGGFVEPTHTAEHTAAKEFHEEAGVLIKNESRFAYLTSLFIDDARYKNSCHKITSSIFVIELEDEEAESVVAGDDLEEVKWFKLGEVYDNIREQHKEIFVKLLTQMAQL
jgi:ADP-ribose pyrophosphatase YjhB (NUDIX family)